jgi:P2 family phage contractile tail tube protein
MSKVINAQAIPEIINNFKVYNGDGDELSGVTGEMSLADLTNLTATISGAGVAGTYNTPVIGQYDSIQQEIPFRVMYKDVTTIMNPMKVARLNIRGAIQVTNKSTGVSEFCGFRYVVGGRCVAAKPGSMQPANPMSSSVTIEATYVLVEIDGEKVIEIDKLNNICKIDGTDLLEAVPRYC